MKTVKDETAYSITLTSPRKCLQHNTYNTVSLTYVLRHCLGVYVCKGDARACKEDGGEQHEFCNGFLLHSGLFGLIIRFLPHVPDLAVHSPLLLSQWQKAHKLSFITLQQPSNMFFPPQITGFPCTFFFLPSLYTPPPPATPSVHQKFTLLVSTNPFECPGERKYSKDMYRSPYP